MISAYVDLARAHAPLLAVTIPFLAAAMTALLPYARAAWCVALSGAAVAGAITLDLALRSGSHGVPPQIVEAVALRADGHGVFLAALLGLCAVLSIFGAAAGLGDGERRAAPLSLALMLCALGGWNGALMTDNLAALIVAAEIGWLASIAVLAAGGERAALGGALRMLVAGGVGAALALCGAALVYRSFGTLTLAQFGAAQVQADAAAAAGVGLVIVSLVIKAGAAPFHGWIGASFGRAQGAALLWLGAIAIVGALSAAIRFVAYAIPAPALGEGLSAALAALGCISVVIGSLQAIGARNLPRLAAYASAAQAGCILLSIGLGSPAGFAAALVQMTALAASALALFGGAAAAGVQNIEALDGVGRRAPLASAAMTAGALSLMGAPLTLGFLGRWRLVEASVGAEWWWAAGAVIVASLSGVFYGGRLIERLYFRHATQQYTGGGGWWRIALAPVLIAAIAATGWGLAPAALLDAANAAAGVTAGAP